MTTKTLRRRYFSPVGKLTHSERRLTLHLTRSWSWQSRLLSDGGNQSAIFIPSLPDEGLLNSCRMVRPALLATSAPEESPPTLSSGGVV